MKIASEEKPPYEFLIHAPARARYGFDHTISAGEKKHRGEQLIKTRILADEINRLRSAGDEKPVEAGEIFGLALLNAVYRWIFLRYRIAGERDVFSRAFSHLEAEIGKEETKKLLVGFIGNYPGERCRRIGRSADKYLGDREDGRRRAIFALQDLMILYLNRLNPAIGSFRELRDDEALGRETFYERAMSSLEEFFRRRPGFGPGKTPLLDLLKQPAVHSPHSLFGQLEFVRTNWSDLLSPDLESGLLVGLDIIREGKKRAAGGPGPVLPPGLSDFGASLTLFQEGRPRPEREDERYSADQAWMPSLVLLAKNTYVWLDQLSRRYRRRISTLDGIPDEEFDRLAEWGFTGLWLIGIWERSPASARIKRECGNRDAISSAYSIHDYEVAGELGGKKALEDLSRRLKRRGIRLAGDMVPNHMGIDSRWVVEKPHYFLQTAVAPFPGYRFDGPDLSGDGRVGIFLEDGYWTRRDAAVVFKRVDKETGEARYLYHGNDGTSMPWNDTAQIDFLNPRAREAVIRTILKVAKVFPIIRFDAAMVLTRRHFQRLWYPPPGTGGAIPSRAGYGLSEEEFGSRFGKEFWREVVERVEAEAPGTLLLAEAFWLLEGYFVRTLGMHRVYNSAFMNMLKMEFNSAYRQVLKEILEFDPRILKRLVNFMNNPDEATAIAQFGKGDKYFGVCVMMITLPGLALFGHGQVEGLTEKYGMEFKKAYWDEPVDSYIVSRHEAEVFPLLKRRRLFSESDYFELFDFYLSDGKVNEDVFAYTNRSGGEGALVVYHNRFSHTSGWINLTAAKLRPEGEGVLRRLNLPDALGLTASEEEYYLFREFKSGLTYLRRAEEVKRHGLYLELGPYQYQVFVDWKKVKSHPAGDLGRLESLLGGRGVPSIDKELRRLKLIPLHRAMEPLCRPQFLTNLLYRRGADSVSELDRFLAENVAGGWKTVFPELVLRRPEASGPRRTASFHGRVLKAAVLLGRFGEGEGWTARPYSRRSLEYLFSRVPDELTGSLPYFRKLFLWSGLYSLHRCLGGRREGVEWMDELMVREVVAPQLAELGCGREEIEREYLLLQCMVLFARWLPEAGRGPRLALERLFAFKPARAYLGVHVHGGIRWFNRESFEDLIYWLFATEVLAQAASRKRKDDFPRWRGLKPLKTLKKLVKAAGEAGYRVDDLLTRKIPDAKILGR